MLRLIKFGTYLNRTEILNLLWLTIFLVKFILNFYGETHFDCHKHYPPIALENCTMEKKEERVNYLGIHNIMTCVQHGTIQR